MNNLKRLRLLLGLRQKDFGEALGLNQQTYAGYENGNRDPPSDFWISVAEKYGVTVDYLLGLSDDPHKASVSGLSAVEERYYRLDATGRKLVDAVMEIEGERFREERVEPLREIRTKIIPLFPAAAGPGEPVDGSAFDDYEVQEDSAAQFAVRISGDSMEPELHDGEVVLCERREPQIGELAVIQVNGFLLVKQYIHDGKNIFLRSLNRARKDLDVDIWASGNDTVIGYGTVIHRKLPLVEEYARQ